MLRDFRSYRLAKLLALPLLLAQLCGWASAPPEVPPATPPEAPVVNPTATPVRPSVKVEVDKDELLGHIRFLADPELRGREAGSPEQLKAADYIAAEFKRYGLEPFGDTKDGQRGYVQEFNLPISKGLGEKNTLVLVKDGKEQAFQVRKQFAALSVSKPKAAAEGGMVFAGYGIAAPEYGYDDFKDVNLEGKWALVLRFEPQEFDAGSKFNGRQHTQHAGLNAKVAHCVKRKAAGVLIVSGPAGREKEADKITDGSGAGDESAVLPVVNITRETANALLEGSGKSLGDLQGAIDKDLSNQSFELKGATVKAEVELQFDLRPTRNIIGRLEGSDPQLKQEHVIIGAHCDHVGLGREGSLLGPEGAGKIHPGADDNASGTAGLLEISQRIGALKPAERPKRSLIFVAFTGEEKGLLGAQHYLKQPQAPLKDTIAMLNMDMIGRSEDDSVQIAGVGTGKGFKDLVQRAIAGSKLRIYLGSSGEGPSDHAAFYRAGLPVLFFFAGLHPDYHRPTDTWEKINAPVARDLSDLAGKVLIEIANLAARPEYIKPGSRGYLGLGVDQMRVRSAIGFPVGAVAPGSPAATAGLKSGDLIMTVNGQKIQQAMDFNILLLDFGAGDTLQITVKRGEEKLELKVQLADRK